MGSRTWIVAVACAVAALVVAVGIVVRPHTPALSAEETGDPGLLDRARPLLAGGTHDRVSVVEIDGDRTLSAHFGADGHTGYEIGSVTKTMTGALLADAVERGEVTGDTRLGELVDLDGAPAADVTLAELSSHRSGLPRLPGRLSDVAISVTAANLGLDPYPYDYDTLVAQVAAAELSGRGESGYSNMGTAVLGQALANAAGTDYATLLRDRLLDPLGMGETILPDSREDLPEDATVGYTDRGRLADPWLAHAYAPAGGVRSTPADMERYVRALLEGTAPGTAALEPRWEDGGGGRIGYAWVVEEHGGTEVTWHNGGTGGFSAMVALDREGDRAVLAFGNTTTGLEPLALELLTGEDS
ncbi:CubicO group peptidase (beta-lactamase class C family) [Nocardiopsis arvandica]|uniref:CubicO group peptidase (Beta-lactamase class C family) n=1 Tax=Nocardiopsis sinuspersici TaxID=501010 RepID=A0A7Y9XAE6_9ACTN|nr:CubicO group peptidase (beta-lactamase class C family) [Nocardiopsis sinuspersici]